MKCSLIWNKKSAWTLKAPSRLCSPQGLVTSSESALIESVSDCLSGLLRRASLEMQLIGSLCELSERESVKLSSGRDLSFYLF